VVFDELSIVGSTVMGESRMSLLHVNWDDLDDDGGVVVQLIGKLQSGEQVATPQSIGQFEVRQPGEHGHQSVRRSIRRSQPSIQWWVVQQPFANIASTDGIYGPASYKQALRNSKSDNWQAAIDTENITLQERQTWSLVVKPAGHNIVDNKWVFKIKRNSDGTFARDKARLVARGCT
jgi:hypothetical protein